MGASEAARSTIAQHAAIAALCGVDAHRPRRILMATSLVQSQTHGKGDAKSACLVQPFWSRPMTPAHICGASASAALAD
jgi:hypothetical protein